MMFRGRKMVFCKCHFHAFRAELWEFSALSEDVCIGRKSRQKQNALANQLTNGGLNSVWQFGGEQAIVTISA
jgi:hypothetical protein